MISRQDIYSAGIDALFTFCDEDEKRIEDEYITPEEEAEVYELFFEWIYRQHTHFQCGFPVYGKVDMLEMLKSFDRLNEKNR